MADKTLFTPGSSCKQSGIYEIVSETGKRLAGNERTVIKGEPLPPADAKGRRYILKRAAVHKSDMAAVAVEAAQEEGGRKLYGSGETCEASGIYEIVNEHGETLEAFEVTSIKGESFPPQHHAGTKYVLVRAARHKSEQ